MTKKLLFVGAVNREAPPANGEEYKNQMLLGYLETTMRVVLVDTRDWSRNPVLLVKLLFHMLWPRYDKIIISASSASVFQMLDILRFFHTRMRKTVYFVIGGYLPKALADGRYKTRAYQSLSSLVVEGETMKAALRDLGIRAPIHVVPNFKTVSRTWGHQDRFDEREMKFIFVSRIAEQKGVHLIFEALADPRLANRSAEFCVDFFGPIEKEYEQPFQLALKQHEVCHYRGYLDFTNHPEKSYETMSGYHAMLFPTYWMGEGFPGALIDAFICGIPVIASDWNMNCEVITDGEQGRVIPVRNATALADTMLDAITNRATWKRMSLNCHQRAPDFDTKAVLDQALNHIF